MEMDMNMDMDMFEDFAYVYSNFWKTILLSLDMLTLFVAIVFILVMSFDRFKLNYALLLSFCGVNLIALSSITIRVMLFKDYLNFMEIQYTHDIQGPHIRESVYVVCTFLFLLWTVCYRKKTVLLTWALVLLTTAWMLAEYRYIYDALANPGYLLENPTSIGTALLPPIIPILCCILLLLSIQIFGQGLFEPKEKIIRPQIAAPTRKCSNCHTPADTDAVFCTCCGNQL